MFYFLIIIRTLKSGFGIRMELFLSFIGVYSLKNDMRPESCITKKIFAMKSVETTVVDAKKRRRFMDTESDGFQRF